ncbi:MAG: 50S ribosomal protein L11 methyltransferase [Chitinophagales bacterium]
MLKLEITLSENISEENIDILSALIYSYEVDGIEVLENGLSVFLSEELFSSSDFKLSLEEWQTIQPFTYQWEELPNINWNKEWESNFDPVFVDDFLTIKAEFHNIPTSTKHTIIINPKMSFGTGHHATTWMVSKLMAQLDFKNKKVLDAGSGTGVLAILANVLGATDIVAFDNDPWCYENALENLEINGVTNIKLIEGSLAEVDEADFDIILANINRNFILEHGNELANKLKNDSLLIVSGFLIQDVKLILDYFHNLSMVAQYLLTKGDWSCVILKKW